MRAIGINRYGDASVVEDWELAVPVPGPGEALVEVAFAGINFMDVHTRQGKYHDSRTYPVRLPVTLGMEGAGTITRVGPGVEEFCVGDRVAWCLWWGSYAQYALVPVSRLVGVPSPLGLDLAAASLFQGCTAHYLVHDVAGVGADTTCLVLAGAGAIGSLVIQMARERGARVIATASSPEKARVARHCGADEVFEHRDGRFAQAVRDVTSGQGADVTFDPVGAATLRESLRATRTRGMVVNYGSVSGPVRDLDPLELGEAGSLWLTRPRLADYIADRGQLQRRAAAVFSAIMSGDVVVALGGEYHFATVRDAHVALEERRQLGKAVLRVSGER